MYATASVFDVLENDQSMRREASRKALALAHARVDSHLGRFLGAAENEREFAERLALVQEDFSAYVATAAQECGFDSPEHIEASLTEHYRAASHKPPRQWSPRTAEGKHWIDKAIKHPGALHEELGVPKGEKIPESKMDEALHSDNPEEKKRAEFAEELKGFHKKDKKSKKAKGKGKQSAPLGHQGSEQDPSGKTEDPGKMQDSDDGKGVLEPHQDDKDKDAPKIKSSKTACACGCDKGKCSCGPNCKSCDCHKTATMIRDPLSNNCVNCGNPVDRASAYGSRPGQPDQILCANCSAQQPPANPYADARPQVPQANTVQQPIESFSSRHADNAVGLSDKPEPVMDKRLWTPSAPGEPKVDDGQWHNVRKDMTEPIGPPNNEHPLKEIGDAKRESLPTSENAGFDPNNMPMAPHTKVWPDRDQTNPVTRESIN